MKSYSFILFMLFSLLPSGPASALGPGTFGGGNGARSVAETSLPQVLFIREEGEQSLHPRVFLEALQGASPSIANISSQAPFLQDLMASLPLAIAEIQRTDISRDGIAPVSRELNNLAKRIMEALREQYRGEVAKNGRKVITLLLLPSSRHGEFWGRGASLPIGRAWTYVYLPQASRAQSQEMLSSLVEEVRRQGVVSAAPAAGGSPQVEILGVRIEAELTQTKTTLATDLILLPTPGTYPIAVDSPEVVVEAIVVPRAAIARERALVQVETKFESDQEYPSAQFSLGRLSGLAFQGERFRFALTPPQASLVHCPELVHLQGQLKDSAVPYDFGILEGNRARFGFLGGRINGRTGLIESLTLRTDLRLGAWVCVHPDLVARRFEAEINLMIEGQAASAQPGSSIARELIMAVEAWERAQPSR
jgi:hypothetical protein